MDAEIRVKIISLGDLSIDDQLVFVDPNRAGDLVRF